MIPPSLEVRRVSNSGVVEPWIMAVEPPSRRWWHVVLNPEGTRTLAAQTLVERLYLAEVNGEADSDDARTVRSLVANVGESALVGVGAHEAKLPAATPWEWRIVIRDDTGERTVVSERVSA